MKNNKIPRKFNRIVGRMLVNTNVSNVNDIIHIQKDEYNGLLSFNTRTQEYSSMFISILRNSQVFELVSID